MRRASAEVMRIRSRLDLLGWAANQVRDSLLEPNWKYTDLTDNASLSFPEKFRRVGECRHPL